MANCRFDRSGIQRPDDDFRPIGPELPPAVIARRLFQELRGQGISAHQIRRIALALITTTDAIPTQSAK
jgi:hypothetical protein